MAGAYLVRSGAGLHGEEHEISGERYAEVQAAWNRTLVVAEIEEKFNILLENYSEFEQELLVLTLRYVVFNDFDWSSSTGEIYGVNRRLANLLMSARLYLDQADRDVGVLYGKSSQERQQLKDARSKEYDNHLAFRVLEGLRNYSQHFGLPVSGLSYDRDVKTGAVRCNASVLVADLATDVTMKPAVIQELRDTFGSRFKITPLVRSYIGCFPRIHDVVRRLVDPEREERVSLLEWTLRTFGNKSENTSVTLEAPGESLIVFEALLDRTEFLIRRSRAVEGIALRYVSGEATAR